MDNIQVINALSVVPLRSNPSHSSEMISQVLFGELLEVIEKDKEWLKVKSFYDDYTGWLDEKQVVYLNENEAKELKASEVWLTKQVHNKAIKESNKSDIYLPAGARLPFFDAGKFSLASHHYTLENTRGAVEPKSVHFKDEVLALAQQFLNTPYLWGGRTHFGIDCSGFSQIVYKILGIQIKRDAWQQAEQGKLVDFLAEAQPGDLAFFDNEEGRITHVGIMMNNHQIIHASGRVKIDEIDNQGIFSSDLKRYSHQLRIIKRYV